MKTTWHKSHSGAVHPLPPNTPENPNGLLLGRFDFDWENNEDEWENTLTTWSPALGQVVPGDQLSGMSVEMFNALTQDSYDTEDQRGECSLYIRRAEIDGDHSFDMDGDIVNLDDTYYTIAKEDKEVLHKILLHKEHSDIDCDKAIGRCLQGVRVQFTVTDVDLSECNKGPFEGLSMSISCSYAYYCHECGDSGDYGEASEAECEAEQHVAENHPGYTFDSYAISEGEHE